MLRLRLCVLIALARAAASDVCAFSSGRLVYLHFMKCGGLSIDQMLRCHCSSSATPCALLREDGSAKHAGNHSGEIFARFKDALLYGSSTCGGGDACRAALSQRSEASAPNHMTLIEGSRAATAPPTYCHAQVLATHDTLSTVMARRYWASASVITVLREPVRVRSCVLGAVYCSPVATHVWLRHTRRVCRSRGFGRSTLTSGGGAPTSSRNPSFGF